MQQQQQWSNTQIIQVYTTTTAMEHYSNNTGYTTTTTMEHYSNNTGYTTTTTEQYSNNKGLHNNNNNGAVLK